MRHRFATTVTSLAGAAALLCGLALGSPPALAAPGPHVIPPVLMPLDGPVPEPAGFQAVAAGTTCATPAASPVPDGQRIVVTIAPGPSFTVGRIPAGWWASPPYADPSWQLRFRGLMWVPPLAQRAFDDGQRSSLGSLVAQAVAAHTQNPDPGTSTKGWDEGTALRRLEALNCLYTLTQDARLVTPMKQDANVLLGTRYYGPPKYRVHNHGLMANLHLLRASHLLGITTWKTTALARMRREAPLAFSPAGITYEQSAGYQEVNRRTWTTARARIAAEAGTAATVATLDLVLGKAITASRWMTEPDGFLPQIGDTEQAERGLPGGGRTGAYVDKAAGWVVGRWSWTDPATTFYVVRFGPPRYAHGHEDRGGLTFTTAGVRVLVGPGKYDYTATTTQYRYQLSPAANNVLVATGTFRPSSSVVLKASTVQSAAHAWLLADTLYGPAHTRDVNVNALTRALRVTDAVGGGSVYRQRWSLDPAWTLVSSSVSGRTTRLVFKHPSGLRLGISTSGRLEAVVRGQRTPYAGWHYPAWGTQVPACVVVIVNRAPARTTTSFSVS